MVGIKEVFDDMTKDGRFITYEEDEPIHRDFAFRDGGDEDKLIMIYTIRNCVKE